MTRGRLSGRDFAGPFCQEAEAAVPVRLCERGPPPPFAGLLMNFIFAEVKRVALTLAILDGGWVLGALLLGRLDHRVVVGALYGFIFTLLCFVLLGVVVKNALDRPADKAKRYLQINYIGRYALLFAIFAVAFLSEHVDPWCVAVSFLAPKLTYTLIGFWDHFRSRLGLPEKERFPDGPDT